jgi:capsular exopolysaccharide synthesis family protein
MGVVGYLKVLRERWRIVCAAFLLGLAVAVGITMSTHRAYASSVTIFISAQGDSTANPGIAYEGSLLSAQKVKSYVELLKGRRLAQDVIDTTKVPMTAEALAGEISASSKPDTVLLTATVTDGSAARAQLLANAIGDRFSALVAELEAPVDGGQATVAARVVQPAALPTTPVAPRPVRDIGLGALIGLVAGVAAAILRHTFDTSIKSAEQLREATTAPSLGTVGYDGELREHALAMQTRPLSVTAESIRQIRASLQFIDVDRARKVMVVSSPLPEEGKTTTLCNLAIAIAQADTSVVLVEADLRRPRAARYLGIEGAAGLTSVLAGQASLDDVLQPWGDDLFTVLASGPVPPNPSELLGSEHMREVLTELSRRFEVVLIDTPPLIPFADARVLAAACDGVVMVFRHGKTTQAQVRDSIGSLDAVGVRVLGTVLNMVPAGRSSHYSYYYAEHSETLRSQQPGDARIAHLPDARTDLVSPSRRRRAPSAQPVTSTDTSQPG